MKKLVPFLLIVFSTISLYVKSQDVSIPLGAVKNGWGWNSKFSYQVANPSQTAGVGCSATTVSKVSLSGWAGSFAIADTTGLFAWSSVTNWSKYNYIEVLVYAEDTLTFLDTVSYKGWDNAKSENVAANCKAISPLAVSPKKWQVITIDLKQALVNSTNSSKTYNSLSDMGLNTLQFVRLNLGVEKTDIYIGAITLKTGTIIKPIIPDTVEIPLIAVRNGWGWNNSFNYGVSNPDVSAGVGCSTANVTKVGISGWCGSFGICDTTGFFSWANTTDWSKYTRLEMLIYSDVSFIFLDSIGYKGWNNANIEVNTGSVFYPTDVVANEWQKISIDMTAPLVDSKNAKTTYANPSAFGLNVMQIVRVNLGNETGNIYIGKILLTTGNAASDKIEESKNNFVVYPNPAKNILSINGNENATISIATISGTIVLSSNDKTIDISSIPAGLYIVTIITADGITSEKVIIE